MTQVLNKQPSIQHRWLAVVDDWCERIGDAVNPILVKEARQALKSRQFVFTFSALLLAALGWTIIGSLSMMPQIYTSPSAPRMLTGYYFVLAVPMLLVVPMAAYRSLEGEIEDGTLELLSISALGPWQIVLGKLASAMLQMALYFVALFPCVAYAYNLRGVDLPTTMMIMGILFVAGVMLTIASLFMAAISSSRTGRITSLFVVVSVLFIAQWMLGLAVVTLISYGNPFTAGQLMFAVTATVALSLSIGCLLVTATAAQLTPESENRSTKIRLAMLVFSAVVIGIDTLAIQTLERDGLDWVLSSGLGTFVLWGIAGSMLAAESPIQTPRIRRELPQSFLARSTLTWLTPGPATGLVFAVVNIVGLTATLCILFQYMQSIPSMGLGSASQYQWTLTALSAYLVGFLVIVRMVVALIRTRSNPRAEIGLIVLIAVAGLFAFVPYSIELHLNDYRDLTYSPTQVTNWVWTLERLVQGKRLTEIVVGIAVLSSLGFMMSLILASRLSLPRRTAIPERVAQELRA